MLLRLVLKAAALLTFFFTYYVLYSALIVLLREVLNVSREPQYLRWPFLLTLAVSIGVAVWFYRLLSRLSKRRAQLAR